MASREKKEFELHQTPDSFEKNLLELGSRELTWIRSHQFVRLGTSGLGLGKVHPMSSPAVKSAWLADQGFVALLQAMP